jgi:hypothetical protein
MSRMLVYTKDENEHVETCVDRKEFTNNARSLTTIFNSVEGELPPCIISRLDGVGPPISICRNTYQLPMLRGLHLCRFSHERLQRFVRSSIQNQAPEPVELKIHDQRHLLLGTAPK